MNVLTISYINFHFCETSFAKEDEQTQQAQNVYTLIKKPKIDIKNKDITGINRLVLLQ